MLCLLLCGCDDKEKQAKAQEDFSQLSLDQQQRNDELREQNAQLEYQIVQDLVGEDAAYRWSKCVSDPPKQKRNQESCARLIARVKKAEDAEDQQTAKEKAKW
jgi:hypothetical protein